MRPTLSLKTLFRTPFKTAITFLLVAAASFALFSRVADYAVTVREMSRIKNSYHGTVEFDNDMPKSQFYKYSNLPPSLGISGFGTSWFAGYRTPQSLAAEQINAFSSLPEATVETRYMTGGIINDYRRLNPRYSDEYDWGYDYTARFVFEGTFVDCSESLLNNNRSFKFTDIKNLAGDAYTEDGGTVTVLAGALTNDYGGSISFDVQAGTFSLPVRFATDDDSIYANTFTPESNSIFLLDGQHFEKDFIDGLKSGERYIFIGRYVPNTYKADSYTALVEELRQNLLHGVNLKIIDMLEDESEFTVIPLEELIENEEKNYGERYAEDLRKLISGENIMRLGDQDTFDYVPSVFEKSDSGNLTKAMEIADITNQDLHTFDIVYTDNMAAIPRFNEKKMTITDGRAITAQDTDSCVVSQYFFDTYGLKIGDTLTVELGDKLFEQNAGIGAISYIPERKWSPVKTVELKIAGVYLDIDPQNERNMSLYRGYSPNTIFVSTELLPITPPPEHEFKPGEASMFINNIDDIDAFLKKAEPLAAELGLKLNFSDGGWSKVKDGINASVKTSLINALLFIFAAALALVLSAYLYIGRKKKDYAIMRALGTPRNKSRNALALPLAALTVFAVPVGGIAGLVYTSNSIKSTLENFGIYNVSLPIGAIILCFIGELAFIAIITALFLYKLGKTPPLSLLQGNVIKAADIAEIKAIGASMPVTPAFVPTTVKHEMPKQNQYSAFLHVTSYIFKHMRRVGLKTTISITLAAVLTGAVGLLAVTRLSYDKLYKTVDVKSTATGFSSVAVTELSESDLVESSYFYGNFNVALNGETGSFPLTVTNNLERYLQDDYWVEYTNGFSDSIFSGDEALCVIGGAAAKTIGVKSGDNITVMSYGLYDALYNLYFYNEDFRNNLKVSWGKEFETDEEFQTEIERNFNEKIKSESTTYKIAGIINSENSAVNSGIFTPPGDAAEAVHSVDNRPAKIEFCEIILADNEKISETENLLAGLKAESVPFTFSASYYTDTAELDNIRRVRDLLATLFPIAVTAAVLIGATAPLLIIIQSAKEAAIMRILGTTKKRTRCILAFEQIILCAVGLACAAGGLAVYNAGLFAESTPLLAVCGVLYLLGGAAAALVASVSVTSRKVLELLQVKE